MIIMVEKKLQCSFYITGKPADLLAFMGLSGGDWDVKESKGEHPVLSHNI